MTVRPAFVGRISAWKRSGKIAVFRKSWKFSDSIFNFYFCRVISKQPINKMYLVGLMILCLSCKEHCAEHPSFEFEQGMERIRVDLIRLTDSSYQIKAVTNRPDRGVQVSTWALNYPVYRFDCADVDGDGCLDIAVGVVKRTRFDPVVRKRLFLFKLFEGYVRPLWLGSRLSQPLEDFRLDKTHTPALIHAVEQSPDGSLVDAEYRWRGFGLEFVRYLK